MAKRFENQYFVFAAILLAVGDMLTLLLFTFFGTMEHQMDSGFTDIWNISLPFILGWILSGLITGAYRSKAYSTMSQAAAATIKTAVPGLPLGLVIRWLMYGKPPSWEFVLAAAAFIFLFLLLWRFAYTWLIRNI